MSMKCRKKVILIAWFFLLIVPIRSFAWNNVGHQVVAQIAYQHLTPTAKQRADQLVHQLSEDYPKTNTFVRAAMWADWLKGSQIDVFDHWHYIDQPYSFDGTALPAQNETHNVIWAIKKSERVLQGKRTNELEKALFLRFLIHFVGDIHQPLHSIAVFSHQHPTGDKGGNAVKVISPYGKNLHQVWDRGVGVLHGAKNYSWIHHKDLKKLAAQIEQDYPPEYFGEKLTDLQPEHWAAESRQIAIQFVYQVEEKHSLDKDYVQQGQQLAKQRLALAGYRLAKVLNDLLG